MGGLKKILILLGVIIMITLLFVGCSNESEVKQIIDSFTKDLNDRKFDKLYENISIKSKKEISYEEFTNRYEKIYGSINARDINIKIKEIDKDLKILASMSINTIVGKLDYDNLNINLVKEDDRYKILWDESLILPNMKKGDLVRVETKKATRGKILDRNDEELAIDSNVNSVYIHPEVFNKNKIENIDKVATILDISKEYIEDTIKDKPSSQLVHLLNVSPYENDRINNLKLIEGISIKEEVSRVYKNSEALGNLIGYIGNITKEELEKSKGYSQTSKIGKAGLEQIYEDRLRAIDGVEAYLKRGNEKIEIGKVNQRNGEDIKLSIDSKLQDSIYNELKGDKGASIAINPLNGEVLAMVSSPSYNSNTLVTYKTKEIANKWENQNNIQFENRANDSYSPGSTIKLITSSIGLESGVINPNEYMDIKGESWQKDSSWGNYSVTRVKDTKRPVNLYDAVKYSDNIYFADKAIKLGEEDYIKGLKKFGIGEKITFEYPMQNSQISNNGKLDNEILLGDTGYGQGEILMTPLDVVLSYSALVNDGNIMIPRLVISENKESKVYKNAIDKKYIEELKKCFKGAINDEDSTGYLAKIEGKNIMGKTGTAEIKNSKDDNSGINNGWFVAVNEDDPKIAISMIVENINKSTSEYVVPKVKNILNYYLN
ncbi:MULTISPECIES: penicillin-binding transpeptidase domain-containing protein [unclassified Romboutsia]|nr:MULTISPECIES: penicillin-binding transpeptidase domain-containing protein [unclassified Romboutsia]MDB8805662.1 penicillin-binding transpeptidase domain-containing protein [Romboutsia sp. 1001216sp1]MDB8807514.1 penicillin-binding transpeptidase domain-containing protein [Romboutsia sp. 1001216sp1]MDB8811137.1 penicillin-binding transpeptidase domain-containing protein [Romboutsia sp. 1001216sp1]MDB8816857.1 penicillin-binding transpeptidase domain-containing protein [Romboutsia sp. 1001216s